MGKPLQARPPGCLPSQPAPCWRSGCTAPPDSSLGPGEGGRPKEEGGAEPAAAHRGTHTGTSRPTACRPKRASRPARLPLLARSISHSAEVISYNVAASYDTCRRAIQPPGAKPTLLPATSSSCSQRGRGRCPFSPTCLRRRSSAGAQRFGGKQGGGGGGGSWTTSFRCRRRRPLCCVASLLPLPCRNCWRCCRHH